MNEYFDCVWSAALRPVISRRSASHIETLLRDFRGGKRFSADYHEKSTDKDLDSWAHD